VPAVQPDSPGTEPQSTRPHGADPHGADPLGADPLGIAPRGADPLGIAPSSADRRRTDPRTRVTGVIVVGMSIAVWWPAFTLGAWGEPFFDQMLTMWAAATGGLIVVLIQPRGRPRIARALALAVPSLWLTLSFVFQEGHDDLGSLIVGFLGVVVAVLALPATIWVLARIIWPEFGDDIARPRRLLIVGAVAIIAVASFVLGLNQSKFLTCEDFTISGNSEPPGCTPLDDAG
jgi:hypothetical protein